MQAILRQSSRDWKQTRKAFDHYSWRSRKLRAGMRLVVAIGLQPQHLLSNCVPRVIRHLFGRRCKSDLFANLPRGNALAISQLLS
jgi:hypothetical protein